MPLAGVHQIAAGGGVSLFVAEHQLVQKGAADLTACTKCKQACAANKHANKQTNKQAVERRLRDEAAQPCASMQPSRMHAEPEKHAEWRWLPVARKTTQPRTLPAYLGAPDAPTHS